MEIKGVASRDGLNQLTFMQPPDRSCVFVMATDGRAVVTVKLDAEAWNLLVDRYGGPMSGLVCEALPEEDPAALLVKTKDELSAAIQMRDYYQRGAGATNKLETEKRELQAQVQGISATLATIVSERDHALRKIEELERQLNARSGRAFDLG